MAEEDRRQSPHYIPELDPDNPKSGPKSAWQRFLWILLILGFGFLTAGVAFYATGHERPGLILAAIGLILLAPFWVFIGG